MTRRPAAVCCLLALSTVATAVEYLPPMTWNEPTVVQPGKTDAEPPSDAVVLFGGGDLSAWEGGEQWKVEDGVATIGRGAIRTKQHFGDCQLHLEWSAPVPATGAGQGRGNSGVFFHGVYEVQVLDSYDNGTYPEGQAASIYKQTPPMVNAMRKPGEWNSYDLFWTSPRFRDGKLAKPATVTVVHNGVLVVNHHELFGDTAFNKQPSYVDLGEKGPIMLQDHGNPVRFRNIWVRELNPPTGTPRPAMFRDGDRTWPVEESAGE